MNSLLAAVLLSTALAAQSPPEAGNRWREYPAASPRSFTVSLPGPPKVQTQTIAAPGGQIVFQIFACEMGGTSFTVTCAKYPDGQLRQEQSEELFDAVRDAFIRGINGKLVGESRTSIETYRGREIECKGGNGTVGRMRVFVVKDRLYQVIGATQEGTRGNAYVNRFLNSFQLVAEQPAGR